MTLAGFVRDGGFNLYAGPERIAADDDVPADRPDAGSQLHASDAGRDPNAPGADPLDFIARELRDALDEVGRKISLADWRALTRTEREPLDHARDARVARGLRGVSRRSGDRAHRRAAARARRGRRALMNLPFGLNVAKPRHFRDMARIVWRNRDQLPYAWRILRDGVCDGCALGPRGLRDDVIDGVHLCMTRLELLRLNTMPALDPALLNDVARLRRDVERGAPRARARRRIRCCSSAAPRLSPPRAGTRPRRSPASACARRRPSAWPSSRPRAASPTRPTTWRRRWRARSAPTTSTTTRASATPPARPP